MKRKYFAAAFAAAAAGGGLAIAAPAQAAFPGENGEIAFARTLANPTGPDTVELRRELRIIDPATGGQRVVDSGTATVDPDSPSAGPRSGQILAAPEFSSDGKSLASNSYAPTQPDNGLFFGDGPVGLLLPYGKDIRFYDAATGTHTCSYTGATTAGRALWDGARNHALLSRAPDLTLTNFFDGAPERVDGSCNGTPAAPSPVPLNSQFAISPDGNRIVTGADFAPDGNSPPGELIVRNIDGSGALPPFDLGNGFGFYPDWTPDGSEVVFGFQDDGTGEGAIKALNPATGQMRTIVSEPSSGPDENIIMFPSVSPDGTKIVYSRINFGNPSQASLFIVDANRDAADPSAADPDQLTNPSGSPLSADLQPDWGPKPVPELPPPSAPPAAIPGAPGSGNQVCGTAPERRTSKKGTPRYTKQGLKIQQNIDSAVIIRLETINKLLDEGVPPEFICTGALGPQEFQPGMSFAGGGHQRTDVPPTPELEFRTRKKNGEIQKSLAQLRINEKISRVLFARAKATYERIENLTGGNLAPGAKLGDRVVWQGLATTGAQPPSADAPATELEVGKLPKKFRLQPNAKTVRNQQRRSQASINTANKALDALAMGLTGEHFQDGSIGSDRF